VRILYCLPSLEIGGAEKVFHDTSLGLRARGHTCSLAVPTIGRGRGVPEIDVDAWDALHEVDADCWRHGCGCLTRLLAEYDLLDLALFAPEWRRPLAAAGRPIVHTIHSIVGWSIWYTYNFYQGEPVAAVVTVDRQAAAYVGDLWPGLRVRHIPNGIDVSKFGTRNAERETHSPPVVGTIGRISPWAKHHVMFARLAGWVQSRARAEGRPAPVFRIVGGSRPENRYLDDRLRAEAEKADGEIEITGYVPPEAVPGHLAAMDVFLLTSSTEGSPLALLEAMVSGLPCVATAVGGVPELLLGDGGPRGALVAVDDDEAAGKAVEGFLADPDLARVVGRRARAYVEREHTLGLMVERREKLYEEILGSGERGTGKRA